MEDTATITSGKGFKYVNTEIVHETEYQKIKIQVVHVPKGTSGLTHHIQLVITKLSKTPKQSWDESEVSKISFTSDKPQSLQKLMAFLHAQPELAKYEKAVVRLANKTGVSPEDHEFIQRVLTSFDTPEKRELLVKAKKEDVNNLYAAVRHAKNKKATNEFVELLNRNSLEVELQRWIRSNTWVFGVEYIKFLDLTRIGIHSDSDFMVESLDGYADLIELKKCEFKLFNHDASHDSYYPTADLSQVIGQSIKYLKNMEDSRHLLKDEDGIDVLKPRIKIVIGKSSDMNNKEREALRLLNDSLHNIEIITYDEVKNRALKMIDHYSSDN